MSRQPHQLFTALMASTNQGDIGYKDGLPWGKPHSTDMEWFKQVTLNRDCYISKKTYSKIPNGLPNRKINILTRPPINKCLVEHLKSINPDIGTDPTSHVFFNQDRVNHPILLGGKTIYEKYWNLINDFFVTFIPGQYPSDCKMDLNKFNKEEWDVVFTGQTTDQNPIGLIHFTRNIKDIDTNQLELISEKFEPYYRLTANKSIEIKPGAHGVVDANEFTAIPKCATGSFSIRKSLGKKGLLTSGVNFKRNWRGYPEIIISNRGLETITIKAGEEVGELAFLDNAGFTC